MNNAEVIKGIEMTINGLTAIKNALGAEKTESVSPAKVETPVTDVPVTADGVLSVEQMNAMKYNEFKKYAASLGVKCTGTRDEIMNRILALDGAEAPVMNEPVEEVAEVADETETKSDRPASGKRKLAKKTDEPTKDEFDEQAEKIASDTEIEDIIEALADVDVKATKKNAIEKLAQALRDGLIEVDDDEDEDEDDQTEDTADEDDAEDAEDETDDGEDEDDDSEDEDEEDIEADSYFSQYDPNGFNDPEGMSDERKEAIVEKMDEILTAISEDKLSIDDISTYLEEHCTQDELDLLGEDYSDEDLVMFYMEMIKRTIDNDGDEHTESEDPYEVGEHDMCCGHKLKYVKKTKKYICEVCGAEYEAE